MLNTWSERKKKKRRKLGKKQRANKAICFFIVHFKISELIWEVKSSAP